MVGADTFAKQRATNASISVRANASRIVIGTLLLACAALVILFQVHGFLAERQHQQLQEKRRLVAALRKDLPAPEKAVVGGREVALKPSAETPETAARKARVEICDFAIRETLRDLQPVAGDPIEIALPNGTWNIRRRVKSTDTQLPGPVREVDCRIDASGEVYSIARVAG